MKNILTFTATFIFLFTSCQTEVKDNPMSYINHINKLELIAIGDEYGEWGGDERKVIIYRDNFKSPLLADYLEITTYRKTRKKADSTKFIKRIKLNDKTKQLIMESINELNIIKINKEDQISHGGLVNCAVSSDSSLVIYDYPSLKWSKFEELVKNVEQQ